MTGLRGIRPRGRTHEVLRRRGNRQSLATLGAATLQNEAAILRRHPDEKAVGAPTATLVGLIRALHGTPVQENRAALEKPES